MKTIIRLYWVLWLSITSIVVMTIAKHHQNGDRTNDPYFVLIGLGVIMLTGFILIQKVADSTSLRMSEIADFDWEKTYEMENKPITAESVFVQWYIATFDDPRLVRVIESTLRARIREKGKSKAHDRLHEEVRKFDPTPNKVWLAFLEEEAAITYGGKQRATA